jgi:hypothetical protein
MWRPEMRQSALLTLAQLVHHLVLGQALDALVHDRDLLLNARDLLRQR